ncbi:MAG: DUF2225 domain-containing protein [Oscillospiraceae bacterium]|nr:DUF2225 domain-containing protein [Oscillospiraceae bacterium]
MSKLLPEGHGSYELQPANDSTALAVVKAICPLCGFEFDNHFLLTSRLGRGKTEPDMRIRHTGIEPLHYAITTCTKCLFSTELKIFEETPKRYAENIHKALEPYKDENLEIKIGRERDMNSVFISFYLALICTPLAVDRNQELECAGIHLKIARLYSDCKDKKMERVAFQKSYEAYHHIYTTNSRIDDKLSLQIAFLLGDISYKLENYDDARQYFYKIKTSKKATPTLAKMTDDRIEIIRDIMNP